MATFSASLHTLRLSYHSHVITAATQANQYRHLHRSDSEILIYGTFCIPPDEGFEIAETFSCIYTVT